MGCVLWNDPYKDYNLTYSLRSDFKYDKLFNLEYLIPNLENYNLTYSIINDTLSSNLFLLQNNSDLYYRKNSGYNLAQVGSTEAYLLILSPFQLNGENLNISINVKMESFPLNSGLIRVSFVIGSSNNYKPMFSPGIQLIDLSHISPDEHQWIPD